MDRLLHFLAIRADPVVDLVGHAEDGVLDELLAKTCLGCEVRVRLREHVRHVSLRLDLGAGRLVDGADAEVLHDLRDEAVHARVGAPVRGEVDRRLRRAVGAVPDPLNVARAPDRVSLDLVADLRDASRARSLDDLLAERLDRARPPLEDGERLAEDEVSLDGVEELGPGLGGRVALEVEDDLARRDAEGAEPTLVRVGEPEGRLPAPAVADPLGARPPGEPRAALLELARRTELVLALCEVRALEEVTRHALGEGILLGSRTPGRGILEVVGRGGDVGLPRAVRTEPALVLVEDAEAPLLDDPARDSHLEDDELRAEAQAVDRERVGLEVVPALAAPEEVLGDLGLDRLVHLELARADLPAVRAEPVVLANDDLPPLVLREALLHALLYELDREHGQRFRVAWRVDSSDSSSVRRCT